MEGKTLEGSQKAMKVRSGFWNSFHWVQRIYWVAGGLANLWGIYGFGESQNWWSLTPALSPRAEEAFWMLVLGVGAPWAFMLACLVGAKLIEILTADREASRVLVSGVVRICFFFAVYHCVKVAFGIKLFSRYLSGYGFVRSFGLYFSGGLAMGTIYPIIVYVVRRTALLRRT